MEALNRDRKRLVAATFGLFAILQIEGCYYMQAVRGQLDLMQRRRPVEEVIADEASPDGLAERLEIVQAARDFAVAELQLPDNQSYRSYADLERDFVVWNVFAAPEFSLEPKRWCFPVAGCVAYRGYFSEKAANKKADRLRNQGYDVQVGGVAAYSTLGRFADPVLNTMMRWSDINLVSTIFHELAHQRLYIKGDTAFNESFATAVADIGVERWLAERNERDRLQGYYGQRALRLSVRHLVDQVRAKLHTLYAQEIDDDLKRRRKRELLDDLSLAAEKTIADSGSRARNWLAAPLNNARLASVGLYEGQLGSFKAILESCKQDLACFYQETQRLAALPQAERAALLNRLAGAELQHEQRLAQ